jgi:CDP-4-dehydro-6-deoxyglucose reductase
LSITRCKVESVSYYNQDTRRILLTLPEGNSIEHKAGQYLEVVSDGKRYPFSIASAPSLKNKIELHIKPTPDSTDSDKVEALLDVATELDIEYPKGSCFLTEMPSGPLILLAASTGITQMKSIVEHLLYEDSTLGDNKHPIFLYWGVVTEQDLYLRELCESWQDEWQAKDVSNAKVIVSGGPGMVYATLDMFIARGMPEENMSSDIFSYAPRAAS